MKHSVIMVLCALALASCEEKVKPTVVPVSSKELPSQESWNSTVVFSDSAHLKAVLWSGHISAFASRQVTELGDSIHVDFYDEQEQHTSLLTARRGVVHDATRDLEAYENVVVTSDSGTMLRTERLVLEQPHAARSTPMRSWTSRPRRNTSWGTAWRATRG